MRLQNRDQNLSLSLGQETGLLQAWGEAGCGLTAAWMKADRKVFPPWEVSLSPFHPVSSLSERDLQNAAYFPGLPLHPPPQDTDSNLGYQVPEFPPPAPHSTG